MRKFSLIVLIALLLPAGLLAQVPPALQPPAPQPAGQSQAQPAARPPAQTPAQPAQSAAQTPAAAAGGLGAGRVAVVDFQRALVENSDGKKAQERFMAELNKRQKDFEDKQKSMTEMQNKLQEQ